MDSFSPLVVVLVDDGTYPAIYFESNPLSRIEIHNDSLDTLQPYEDGIISAPLTLTNTQRLTQQYTIITQVLDDHGIARDICLQSGSLDRGQSTEISNLWNPELQEGYTIQVFVWDQTDDPSPLSIVSAIRSEDNH